MVHHFFHFAAPGAERFHHDADERFRAIDDQQFERFEAPAVFGAHHDFRLADHQLVAFAAHGFDQDGQLQFAAAQHAKRVGGAGIFHAQRDVGEQFLFEPRAQVARSDVLPFAARKWRRVDGEDHRQRRLVDHQRLERRGIGEVGDAFADLNSFHSGDGHDVARRNLLGFVAFQSAEREKLGDLRRLNRSVQFRDAHFGAALQRALKNAGDGQRARENRCNRDW